MNAPARFPHPGLPAMAGLCFKPAHFEAWMSESANGQIGFFEVHAENFMGDGGAPHRMLADLREKLPMSLHGVGLSIGGEGELDRDHLDRLKGLIARYDPASFSEHLAWSTHESVYYNDLLPLPYTKATLGRVCAHIDQTQAHLGRRMLLENPSAYLGFEEAEMSEIDFLTEIATRTGCGLLLDVNNVYISAQNMGFSAEDYLDRFPLHLVGEIHLAGHAVDSSDPEARLLIDAHDRPTCDEVWALYRRVINAAGTIPTLAEWDNDIPDWPILRREGEIVAAIFAEVEGAHA